MRFADDRSSAGTKFAAPGRAVRHEWYSSGMSSGRSAHNPSDALLTDLYCLTMAADYVHEGTADDFVTFELSARSQRAMTVAGVEEALAFLEGMRFTEADLDWLAAQDPVTFDAPVLQRFADLRFGGTAWAIREGTIVPAATPLLRVTARAWRRRSWSRRCWRR